MSGSVLFSSESTMWETPIRFFAELHREFGFTLDACATPENAKCPTFFTEKDDALARDWTGRVWCNPPYGYSIHKWVRKAFSEAQANAEIVVALLPAKTETRWWHDYVMHAIEIRLIRGRLRFSGSQINAPFSSAVVIFQRGMFHPKFTAMDRLLDEVSP